MLIDHEILLGMNGRFAPKAAIGPHNLAKCAPPSAAFSNCGRGVDRQLCRSNPKCRFIARGAPRPRSAAHQGRDTVLVPIPSGHPPPLEAPDGGRPAGQCRRAPIAGVVVSASSERSPVSPAQDRKNESFSPRKDGTELPVSSGPPET